jgi:hypothetical protein
MDNIKKIIREALIAHNIKPDCGCGCHGRCSKAPILNENLNTRVVMTENMNYHIDNKKPLIENTFRYGSKSFLDLWAEARYLYSRDAISLSGLDKEIILETNLGQYGIYKGQIVPLDMPLLENDAIEDEDPEDDDYYENEVGGIEDLEMADIVSAKPYEGILMQVAQDLGRDNDLYQDLLSIYSAPKFDLKKVISTLIEYDVYRDYKYLLNLNEAEYQGKKVQVGKPKRGGASGKKFYVYVMDKGKVKKVSFGDSGGLSTKVNDPKARQAFAKRHNCAQKTDRTTAGYWSCRIGRYWKSLGGSKNFSGYW